MKKRPLLHTGERTHEQIIVYFQSIATYIAAGPQTATRSKAAAIIFGALKMPSFSRGTQPAVI
jgi:hypothetical protein